MISPLQTRFGKVILNNNPQCYMTGQKYNLTLTGEDAASPLAEASPQGDKVSKMALLTFNGGLLHQKGWQYTGQFDQIATTEHAIQELFQGQTIGFDPATQKQYEACQIKDKAQAEEIRRLVNKMEPGEDITAGHNSLASQLFPKWFPPTSSRNAMDAIKTYKLELLNALCATLSQGK